MPKAPLAPAVVSGKRGVSVWLRGPTACGKSFHAEKLAKCLGGLEIAAVLCNEVTDGKSAGMLEEALARGATVVADCDETSQPPDGYAVDLVVNFPSAKPAPWVTKKAQANSACVYDLQQDAQLLWHLQIMVRTVNAYIASPFKMKTVQATESAAAVAATAVSTTVPSSSGWSITKTESDGMVRYHGAKNGTWHLDFTIRLNKECLMYQVNTAGCTPGNQKLRAALFEAAWATIPSANEIEKWIVSHGA